jgi:hypothetical protein
MFPSSVKDISGCSFVLDGFKREHFGVKQTTGTYTCNEIWIEHSRVNIVAYRPAAMQRLRDGQISQSRVWATARLLPLLGSKFLIMKQLDYSNRSCMFHMWSMSRCYKQGRRSLESQYCTAVSGERNWAGGSRITIVGAVIRKLLITGWEH